MNDDALEPKLRDLIRAAEDVPQPSPARWDRFERALRLDLSPRSSAGPKFPALPASHWYEQPAFLAPLAAAAALLIMLLSAAPTSPGVALAWQPAAARLELPPLPAIGATSETPTRPLSLRKSAQPHSYLEALRAALEADQPCLLSLDAGALIFNASIAELSASLEEDHLASRLVELSEALDLGLARLRSAALNEPSQSAFGLAAARLEVLAILLGRPGTSSAEARAEVERIQAAEATCFSRLLDRMEDYRPYRPPTAQLSPRRLKFFRAMTWLSRSSLPLDPAHPQELRAAVLLTLALAEGRGFSILNDLIELSELLYGSSDDLNLAALRILLQDQGGRVYATENLNSDSAMEALAAAASRLLRAHPSQIAGRGEASGANARILGGHRSAQALVASALTQPNRPLSSATDLPAVLGSKLARQELQREGLHREGPSILNASILDERLASTLHRDSVLGGVDRARVLVAQHVIAAMPEARGLAAALLILSPRPSPKVPSTSPWMPPQAQITPEPAGAAWELLAKSLRAILRALRPFLPAELYENLAPKVLRRAALLDGLGQSAGRPLADTLTSMLASTLAELQGADAWYRIELGSARRGQNEWRSLLFVGGADELELASPSGTLRGPVMSLREHQGPGDFAAARMPLWLRRSWASEDRPR